MPKIEAKTLDKPNYLCYNDYTMNNEFTARIPYPLVQEAENLSKETGIPFRGLLEVLYKAFLESANEGVNDYRESVVASF